MRGLSKWSKLSATGKEWIKDKGDNYHFFGIFYRQAALVSDYGVGLPLYFCLNIYSLGWIFYGFVSSPT